MKNAFPRFKKLAALVAIYACAIPTFAITVEKESRTKPLTEDQKIVHVLNRLGFGARPGDVEKVRAIGLQKYIDQQINGISIDDQAAEARVKNLEIFKMSTAEVFAKYPNPTALLRQLEGGRQAQAQRREETAKDGDKKMPAEQAPN